jgi:phage FluMu protein Com
MSEVRCPAMLTTRDGYRHRCNRKLAENLDGSLTIKCSRCGTLVDINSVDRVPNPVV